MSQASIWGVPTTGPATPHDYAGRDSEALNALLSSNSGNTAPGYAVAGTRWLDTSNATAWAMKVYDGADWNTEWTLNPSTGEFKVTNLATPTAAADAATKGYVDGEFASQFAASLAASGYQKLPGGYIRQWGTVTNAFADSAVNFPVAFPNGAINIVATCAGSPGASTAFVGHCHSGTKTGFVLSSRMITTSVTNAGAFYNWQAIGN